MSRTHITLLVRLTNFDTIIETVVDKELLPIVANINKVIKFFVEDLPQEVQRLFVQQFTVFLERICKAGDEANLMREYLGNCFTEGDDSSDLLVKALGALTHKDLLIEDLLIRESLEQVRTWVVAVVSALDTPSITKLVVGTILSIRYWPEDEQELQDLFLSLV